MKNKLLVLILVALFSIITAGCSGDNEKTAANQEKQSAEKETKAEKPEDNSSATAEAEKVDTAAPAESKMIEQTFERITFNMLDSYQQLEIGDQGMPAVLYMMDANARTSFNIVVEKLPEGMSLDQYIQAVTAQTGFEYLSNQNYTEGEYNWNEVVSINPQSKQKMSQRTIIIDGAAYVFTYAANPDAFDKNFPEFVELTKSVKVN